MLKSIGISLLLVGLAIEGVGTAALWSYRVRQMLPGGSPFPLFGIGSLVFIVGLVLIGVGGAMQANAP